MRRVLWTTVTLALLTSRLLAQDYGTGDPGYGQADPSYSHGDQGFGPGHQDFGPGYQDFGDNLPGYGQENVGTPIPSASEPLYHYDDLEVWKHGWIQINPYEHGYHSYRPYNYKHVLSQSAQASAWGMPSTMPYSQIYYQRHGSLTGINGEPIPAGEGITPMPDHNRSSGNAPARRRGPMTSPMGEPSGYDGPTNGPSGYGAPMNGPSGYNAPMYPVPDQRRHGFGMPTSMLRQQPFQGNLSPEQLNNVPGLTQLPGHQFPPQQQGGGGMEQLPTISPTNFQQFHQNPAAGPEYERQQMQKAQIQQLLQQQQQQMQGSGMH